MPAKRRIGVGEGSSAPKKANTTKTIQKPSSGPAANDQSALTHQDTRKIAEVGLTGSETDELTPMPSEMESSGSDSSDEEDWENCLQDALDTGPATTTHGPELGDLEVTLEPNRQMSWSTGKKVISGMERKIRMAAHMLHVQFLLYHGFKRNSWLCDEELQAILLSHVTSGVMAQVEKYHHLRLKQTDSLEAKEKGKGKGKGKDKGKGKGKGTASTAEEEMPDLRAADPLVHLLGILMHFWKKSFTISAPGLRKRGYMSMAELSQILGKESAQGKKRTNNEDVTMAREEIIENLAAFREMAKELEGSRDVGAQFFAALLRALGLEARMVFSLQPLGFSFNGTEMLNSPEAVSQKQKRDSIAGMNTKKRKGQNSTTSSRKIGKESSLETFSDNDSNFTSDEETDRGFDEMEEKPKLPTKKQKAKLIDKDLLYPSFWTEVYSPHSSSWIPVDTLVLSQIFFRPETYCQLEPRGKQAKLAKQVMCYVIAYSSDLTARDVTVRYLSKHILPGKTRGFRVPPTLYPVKDNRGNVIRNHQYDWFRSIMRRYTKPENMKDERDRREDDALKGVMVEKKRTVNDETISGYKNHPEFVLERHLKREEAVKPGKSHVRIFTVGKGDKSKGEKVYRRKDIVICKATENWYKEGRVVKEGEQPLKRVKSRAVTLNRKRELEQAAAENNPILQPLYSYEQTKLYEAPPIQEGKVPRNVFGNCDVYVESMIPKGGVHLPLKGSARIAKKLGIDYADAVTGFEFKKQRAVPVVEGIILAAEDEDLIRDAWTAEEKERKRKEDTKREQAALALWRKFLMGIRIVKRIQEDYGSDGGDEKGEISMGRCENKPQHSSINSASHPDRHTTVTDRQINRVTGPGELAGGFFRDGEDEDADADADELQAERGQIQGEGASQIENDDNNFDSDNSAGAEGGFMQEVRYTSEPQHSVYEYGYTQDDNLVSQDGYTRTKPPSKRRVYPRSRGTSRRHGGVMSLKSAAALATTAGGGSRSASCSSSSFSDEENPDQKSKYPSPKRTASRGSSSGSELTDMDIDIDISLPHSTGIPDEQKVNEATGTGRDQRAPRKRAEIHAEKEDKTDHDDENDDATNASILSTPSHRKPTTTRRRGTKRGAAVRCTTRLRTQSE